MMLTTDTLDKIIADRSFARPLKQISTADLKAMWDSEEYGAYCDEIHAEMTARGEGAYVIY